jgi:putative MFS transporter
MALAVNAGARLDRLPISSFHYRIFWLVGAGMFFDGYDLYIAGGVLASAIQTKFSTIPQNLQFISLTFVGMTLGALITGFVGDKMGRRFTYQINLLIFGLASLAAAFAQDMTQLIACRFVQGLGLGAEIVVGYSTLTEFVPPKTRGRWLSMMAFLVVAGFPGNRPARLSDHPGLRMASGVHHRRRRLADRLVLTQEPAGIAALA